jgi:hypothetical protein
LTITTIKLISALFAAAILFQAGSVEAEDTRVGGVQVSEDGAGEYRQNHRVRARKPWKLDRPGYRGRHPGRSRQTPLNDSKGFEHTVSSEFTMCRRLQFGRGVEICGLRVWVDIKTDEQRSFRAGVYCAVKLEMTYEGGRTFIRESRHYLNKTARMYDGSGYVYLRKRIYGERMHERLIGAEVVRTYCTVYKV